VKSVLIDIELFKKKAGEWLCRRGIHKWSKNRCGIRLCKRCPKVDGYFGLTGLIRFKEECDTKHIQDTEELREIWNKWDLELKEER
jgi:hypothetical protein